jgi:hypothetical protein
MAKPRYVTFAEVASELGISIEELINDVVDRKRRVIGENCETGGPETIPWKYFTIDRCSKVPRADPDDAERDVLSKLYPEFDWNDPDTLRRWRGSEWVDADTGEVLREVYPPTCLDPEEGAIFIDGRPRWINLKAERLDTDPTASERRHDDVSAIPADARPPLKIKLQEYVAAFIQREKASGKTHARQSALWMASRTELPGATRARLYGELKRQQPDMVKGRPQKAPK